MSLPIRRVSRLTVLTPWSELDLEIAEDATPGEIMRLVLADAPSDRVDVPEAGWELLHPLGGVLDPGRQVGLSDVEMPDGDVLMLRPRPTGAVAAPVDDVAELTRRLGGDERRGSAATAVAAFAVFMPPVTAFFGASSGRHLPLVALSGVVVALCLPVLTVGRAGGAGVGALGIVGAATSAGLIAADRPITQILGAALLGALASAGVLSLTTPGRWWRPITVAALGSSTVVAAWEVGGLVVGSEAPALAVVTVLILSAAATPASLMTSGLGRLDDRVAAGDAVSEEEVTAAVGRAGDDLTAALLVVSTAIVPLVGPLAARGAAGTVLALTASTLVAVRARALVRTVHVVPVIVGGCLAAAHVVVTAVGAQNERAVPVLVASLVVAALTAAPALDRGMAPVTAGRWRRAAEIVEGLLVVGVPLLLGWVFDLYRLVWERF